MLKLNCDAHLLRVGHKVRKSDDAVTKIFADLKFENVGPGQTAGLYGLENESGAEVTENLSEGVSQRFPNISRIEIDSKFKVGSAEVIFANLAKQRGEITKFATKPQGLGLSIVWCTVAIELPPAGYYERLMDFEGRSLHVRIEQDQELNVTTKQKAKQAAMDLPPGEVKDVVTKGVKRASKKRSANGASKPTRRGKSESRAPVN